ncbi:MAG: hypothetical protein JKY48_16695, partial [Flavobacteriales bacterium]|nr:hypothetical protein [Flavobacteriales bacterium]
MAITRISLDDLYGTLDKGVPDLSSNDQTRISLNELYAGLNDAPVRNASFIGSVARSVDIGQAMGGAFVEATGEATGIDSLKDWGRNVRERNTIEMGQNPRTTSFKGINSFGDAIDWTKETVGEQIPMMAPGFVGAAAGAALMAPVPIPGARVLGAVIGAFVPSFVMGTGETQMSIKQKDPNAEAPGMAFLGGSAIGALDSALPGKLGSTVMKAIGKDAAEEVIKTALSKRIVAEGVKGMSLEGATEAVQEAIGEAAAAHGAGQEIDWSGLKNQMIEAAAAGAFMGGGASVITEVGTSIMRSAQPEPTGKREQATQEAPDLTDADRASPIPDDLIQEGKAVMKDGEATQSVNELLTEAGVPKVNSRVSVQVGDQSGSGVIVDAYKNGQDGSGVKIAMEDGSTFVAPFDKIAAQDVLISPELPVNPAKQPEAAPLDQVQPQVMPEEAIVVPDPVLTGPTLVPDQGLVSRDTTLQERQAQFDPQSRYGSAVKYAQTKGKKLNPLQLGKAMGLG